MEKEVQTDITKNIENVENIETQRVETTQLEVVQNDALTIEEIETGLVYNGSMVRVADISEEFRNESGCPCSELCPQPNLRC